jgi:hypothetical protein
MFIVGIGSGMFNSPNTAAMMGVGRAAPARDRGRGARARAEHRRGDLDRVRAGGDHLRGAEDVLFKVFSGLAHHISTAS